MPTTGNGRQRLSRWCSATWARTAGTGVAVLARPSTGENAMMGEYLTNAQGEDVVAGIRTPEKDRRPRRRDPPSTNSSWSSPASSSATIATCRTSSSRSPGTLYMLQTRNGKRSAEAAVRSHSTSSARVSSTAARRSSASMRRSLDQLFHARIDPDQQYDVTARGLNASPGAAAGAVVFDADTAVEWAEKGQRRAARAHRDDARRRARHDRRARRANVARRRHLARGRRRPRHGPAVRLPAATRWSSTSARRPPRSRVPRCARATR